MHSDTQNEFTTFLLAPLAARLRRHIPQLLTLPPILAHTIYQTLEFDGVLKSRGYRPRGHIGNWGGLTEVILGQHEWFARWVEGEKACQSFLPLLAKWIASLTRLLSVFDDKYFSAISATDAWQIVPAEDYDGADARSDVRPTHSALRVGELSDQLTERYRPLPQQYTLPFLLSLHLPMLSSYAQRITSSLDAFESLSFGSILPGALAEGRAATAGVGGITRLIRAGVSAKWMGDKCADWGEEAVSVDARTVPVIPSLSRLLFTVFSYLTRLPQHCRHLT